MSNSVHVYTDASKTNNGVGLVMIINYQKISCKLPLQDSILTAEVMVIYQVVNYLHTKYTSITSCQTKCIILSNSLSNLIATTNTRNPAEITKLIQEETFQAGKKEKQIHFVWIPGHIGKPVNEIVDQEGHNTQYQPPL